MISGIRTAVVLVLIIDFVQLLGEGKEYGRFIRLVTGLLIACSICAGILQLLGTGWQDGELAWLLGEGNGAQIAMGDWLADTWNAESLGEEEQVLEEEDQVPEGKRDEDSDESENEEKIEVPQVDEIPGIQVEEVKIGG